MRARWISFLVEFLKEEDGPTTVEYCVLLAAVIVVCLVAISAIGGRAKTDFVQISTQFTSS